MGGGPSTQPSRDIEQQQVNLSNRLVNLAESQYGQQQENQAPLVGFLKNLISGDQGTTMTAAAPVLGNISKGYQQAKDTIFQSTAPGAARDFALTQLPIQENSARESALNSLILNAYPTLANIGNTQGNQALQLFGGGTSNLSGASSTANNVMQAQAASKASTMGFLGQLAGAAASPFTFGGK